MTKVLCSLAKFFVASIKGFFEFFYLIVLIGYSKFKILYLRILFAYQARQIRYLRARCGKLLPQCTNGRDHAADCFYPFPHIETPNFDMGRQFCCIT